MLAAAERSVKWSTRAQIGPVWRFGEAFDARWGSGAGVGDTSGPAGRRAGRGRGVWTLETYFPADHASEAWLRR